MLDIKLTERETIELFDLIERELTKIESYNLETIRYKLKSSINKYIKLKSNRNVCTINKDELKEILKYKLKQ